MICSRCRNSLQKCSVLRFPHNSIEISTITCPACDICIGIKLKGKCKSFDQVLGSGGDRNGWIEVSSVEDKAVHFVLSKVLYEQYEPPELHNFESPYDLPDSSDVVKILWCQGIAVGFYTFKLKDYNLDVVEWPGRSDDKTVLAGELYLENCTGGRTAPRTVLVGAIMIAPGRITHSREVEGTRNEETGNSYEMNTLDTAYIRNSCRRKGYGTSILNDLVNNYPGDVGLSKPISNSMWMVLYKFLSQHVQYRLHFWEVEGTGSEGFRTLVWYSMKSRKKIKFNNEENYYISK